MEYASGCALFCFDIQGETLEDIFGKTRSDNNKLQLNFGTPTLNLMLVLYSLLPSLSELGKKCDSAVMNTDKLKNFMKKNPQVVGYYGGVVPKYLLLRAPLKPSFNIVNQDTSEKIGRHSIVMFKQDNKITKYFDPLEEDPDIEFWTYRTLQSHRYSLMRKIAKITFQIYGDNTVCSTDTSE